MAVRSYISIATIFAFAACFAGCDTVDVDEAASPLIRVMFVGEQEAPASAGKVQAIWDVRLSVTSPTGADYSPRPIQINDAVADEAVFEVELPNDSVYAFSVSYSRSGSVVAAGSVLELVSRNTAEITIPVMFRDGSVPTLGFLPSSVRVPRGGAPIELDLMYFGPAEPISGIACRFHVSGAAGASLSFDGPDVQLDRDGSVDAAWRFAQPVQGTQRIALVSMPISSAGTVCLSVVPGDARTVNSDGSVTSIVAHEACIEVLP
jgi:hypothetical protein